MNSYSKLVVWVLSFQFVGILLGWLIRSSVQGWYQELKKSLLAPPSYVFSFVWPVLYTLLAAAGWVLWNMKSDDRVQKVKVAYIVQMLANWSWPFVYFSLQMAEISVGLIALMIFLTLYMVLEMHNRDRLFVALLAPYALWICFAFYLNYFTWMHN